MKRLFPLVILIISITVSTIPVSHVQAAKSQKTTPPNLIGHRGYSSVYPENTMEAFQSAETAEFQGIEIDIWEADSGELLVFHDSALKRLTGKSGYIWQVSKSNRSRYKVIHNNKGYLIPTFKEVIEYAAGTNLIVYIHIKKTTGHTFSEKAAAKVANRIKKSNMQKRAIVFTSNKTIYRRFCKKGCRLGLTTKESNRAKLNTMIKWLKQNNGDTLISNNVTILRSKGLGSDLVKYCHKRGIQIGCYWTYTTAEYNYLTSIGADFSLSDYNLR